MKSWLKFFGLSFFSDKIAKEARTRGVLNCVLGFVLALLFIFCGLLASNAIPFYSHYNGATDFKDFVHNFVGETEITVNENALSSEAVIDTYLNETDAAKYGKSGYNLVIDTRPATALDDFEAYCFYKDEEISYESYLALPDEEKGNYTFKIRYTANELILTDAVIAGYEAYLNGSADEGIRNEYTGLAAQKGEEGYKNKLYALYLKAYYSGVSAFDGSSVPFLRDYYYINFINRSKTEKSLFIFNDMLFGYFNTDGGVAVNFYGMYNNMSDGAVTDGDLFIKSVFKASVGASANVFLINLFKFIPMIAAIPVLLALITKLILFLMHDDKYKKFTTCLKIEFSYFAVAALITAIVLFICGYFVSSSILNSLPLIVLALVMLVRTGVFIIGEFISVKKTGAQNAAQEETDGTEATED